VDFSKIRDARVVANASKCSFSAQLSVSVEVIVKRID